MEREPTKIILERMLPDGNTELDLEGFLGILSTYYWWNDRWLRPEYYVDDIINDANHEQVAQIAEVLHTNFRVCDTSQIGDTCKKTASDCFLDYIAFHSAHTITEGHIDVNEEIHFWLANFDVGDEDIEGSLRQAYERWLVNGLAAEGATDIEIGNALEVLVLEEERRGMSRGFSVDYLKSYTSFRNQGGTFDEFTKLVLPKLLVEGQLESVILGYFESEYEDVSTLSDSEKAKLMQRFIEEDIDLYYLLEVSYLKYEHGILPYYLYRFTDQDYAPENQQSLIT